MKLNERSIDWFLIMLVFLILLTLICEIEWKKQQSVFNNVGIFNTFDINLWSWVKEVLTCF